MWCVPELNREYVERMENVLDLLARPLNPREPVLALDERPVQLLDSLRVGRTAKPGCVARRDYEYRRCGTANVFCIVEPLAGRHFTHATRNRKRGAFARALARIERAYPDARKIHLIVDNLNTHSERSLVLTFGELEGRRLWRRFAVTYTPKHGSWLNPAEIEVSLWSRECLGKRRVPYLVQLKHFTALWNRDADRRRRKISWSFKSADARSLFRYQVFTTPRSKH